MQTQRRRLIAAVGWAAVAPLLAAAAPRARPPPRSVWRW